MFQSLSAEDKIYFYPPLKDKYLVIVSVISGNKVLLNHVSFISHIELLHFENNLLQFNLNTDCVLKKGVLRLKAYFGYKKYIAHFYH